jgi:hypothetical protein
MRALGSWVFGLLLLSIAAPPTVAQQEPSATDATSALTCIQNALGGTAAFARVSSLYIKAEAKPSRNVGFRPVPGTREISVVFPDRYLRHERPSDPGRRAMSSSTGFDEGVILSSPRHPDEKRAEVSAHQDFARQMLMRLPRTLAGVRLMSHVTNDLGRGRLALEALGTEGFSATLLVDRDTCVPIALQYLTTGAAVSGITRVELSEYRSFGGVQFPMVLRTSVSGQPYHEERVTNIEVNTPAAAQAFAVRR